MTSNHVLGIKVVLPDGEVVEPRRRVALEPVGPDWTGMFCGSEGLFGIAVEVTLRLIPVAEATRTVARRLRRLRGGRRRGRRRSSRAGLLPVAMEIMDALAIEAAEASVKPDYPERRGAAHRRARGRARRGRRRCRGCSTAAARLGRDRGTARPRIPAERALIWKGRKSAFSAVGWLAPDYLVQDGVVPRTRLGEALAEIDRMSASARIRVANVFHAGDGNLHPLILFDGREPGALERAEQLAGDILALCVSLGGSITGEHGVGVEKRDYLPLMFADDDLALMRRMRARRRSGRARQPRQDARADAGRST